MPPSYQGGGYWAGGVDSHFRCCLPRAVWTISGSVLPMLSLVWPSLALSPRHGPCLRVWPLPAILALSSISPPFWPFQPLLGAKPLSGRFGLFLVAADIFCPLRVFSGCFSRTMPALVVFSASRFGPFLTILTTAACPCISLCLHGSLALCPWTRGFVVT